ncbi:MAG TPA: hypothetical protein VNI01_07285 [Elusimicrobiota bacterium]|jgi:hypothetical protein|nr:hypothetical protein [Elusimicrobiota bacterium]
MSDGALACAMLAVLFVGLAAAGALRAARYCSALIDLRGPRAELRRALPGLRTGDLILFVGADGPSAASLLAGTFFSHAGVVVRPGGQGCVWLAESAPAARLAHAGHARRPGAALSPLRPRLSSYLGRCYVSVLQPALGASAAARLEAEALGLCGREAYPTLAHLAASVCGARLGPRHCFQHAHHLLRTAGLLDGEPGPLEACRAVCALPGRALAGGRAYAAPRLLVEPAEPAPSPAEATEPPGAQKAARPSPR